MARPNLFKPILDRCRDEKGKFSNAGYNELMKEFAEHGVKDMVFFLQEVICTYPETNDFLIRCLYETNKRRLNFDT